MAACAHGEDSLLDKIEQEWRYPKATWKEKQEYCWSGRGELEGTGTPYQRLRWTTQQFGSKKYQAEYNMMIIAFIITLGEIM